jgi:MerR family redox-sensitive transcriptional activator SoxR
MSELSISEIARQAGVRPSTIRYYESIGLLASPTRRGGKRQYDPAILQRLAIIRTAQQAGFTLDEVRLLFNEILQPNHAALAWQALIDKKLADLKALLRHVQQMQTLLEEMRQCADSELEECIYRAGQSHPA